MASPSKKQQLAQSFAIYEDNTASGLQASPVRKCSAVPLPLTTSRSVNKLSPKKSETDKENPAIGHLMARISEQQEQLARHGSEVNDDNSSSATDPFANTPPTESLGSSDRPDAAEVLSLKKQLELATERMAQMDLELTQSRMARHTVEQAIGSPFPAAQQLAFNINTPVGPPVHQMGLQARGASPFGQQFRANRPHFQQAGFRQFDPFADQLRPTPSVSPLPNGFGPVQGAPMMYQAPIGTRMLSPTASEFNQPSYMSTAEPLNYRRLLDRNMSCNWKYIVDKIVCNNDQQASIFLQQKLKVGTPDQKFDIVQAIIEQAYPLMVNRFGNFLVQRCFEHGTPEQVIMIAQAIRGNTLNLSMDAFGCHVVQKAFDYVPEEYKAIMVHELLRRIPETVIHRYACHVWQKLFELRWSDSPPQIMRYVNEALRGMWHEVALGETGSLVVQNIFENCLDEDKRPCINEVLASIDVIAHGQFGNWCIQHICEHGLIPDRSRALDHILRFATEYSMDQFASKVVEKCLKIANNDFLDRYLDRICEARPDRPRMPLIDISGDQFGNYLIQYILTNADTERREIVATHIRKHMVSLRGSKYGSRVAMLCCSPAFTTRPGPPGPLSRARIGSADQFGDELRRSYSDRGYIGMPRNGGSFNGGGFNGGSFGGYR